MPIFSGLSDGSKPNPPGDSRPLDDANVERYAKLLKQLAEKTQLLFITHNKITMEVADILVGVTMAEAGVSRLIAVDVAEAAAMAVE